MANRARVSAKSPVGEALKYIAKYWGGLILFLEDGRIELDSNAVERTIRLIALNRKMRSLRAMTRGTELGDIDALLPWNYNGLTRGAGHEHHRVEDHA